MSPQPASIKINGPGDLISVIPYLLGFAPESSLVVAGFNELGYRSAFRVDLPDRPEHALGVPDLVGQLLRSGCGQCIAIVYGPESIAGPVAAVTARRCEAADVEVIEVLRVEQGRYWSLTCDGPCCPPGREVQVLTEAELACFAAGVVALADRAAVAAQFDPADKGARAAVAADTIACREMNAGQDQAAWRNDEYDYVDQWWDFPVLPWPAAMARLGLALADGQIRDRALQHIATHPDQVRLDVWIWLVRHLDGDLVAGAAIVAGFAAYCSGNGTLATEAFHLALAAAPGDERAEALAEACHLGVPPSEVADWIGLGSAATGEADRAN